MTIYFTSDIHFGHQNILVYANRPFKNIDEMNQQIVHRWNSVVTPRDEVYILGDVCMGKLEDSLTYVPQLNGKKYLVKGNHDKKSVLREEFVKNFEWVRDLTSIRIQDAEAPGGTRKIVLCHFALKVWEDEHRGAWHLYGHSHGNMPDDPFSFSIDVGMDCHDWTPISYDRVKELMSRKIFKPKDHHGRNDL